MSRNEIIATVLTVSLTGAIYGPNMDNYFIADDFLVHVRFEMPFSLGSLFQQKNEHIFPIFKGLTRLELALFGINPSQ